MKRNPSLSGSLRTGPGASSPRGEAPPASPPKGRLSPRLAIGLFALAIVVWGVILFLQFHQTPAQRHVEAGNNYARVGDGPNAIREWQAAVKLEPDNAFAWQLLGQSFFEGRQWASARDAFVQLLRLKSDTPRINSLLASCYHHLGNLELACQYARKELQRNPDDIAALETCVAAQAKLGDAQEMIRCLRRLTELEPKKAEHFVALAEALIGQNNVAAVLPVVDRVLELAPSDAEMYVLRGIARFYTDGTPAGMARAEQDFTRGLALRPGIYASYLYLGRISRRRGDMTKAVYFLEEAVRLNPKKADAFFDLAAAYDRTGQPEKAAVTRRRFQDMMRKAAEYVHLKKQCDLSPGDLDLHLKVIAMALQREDAPAAKYYLQKAFEVRPDDSRVQAALQQLEALNRRLQSRQRSVIEMPSLPLTASPAKGS